MSLREVTTCRFVHTFSIFLHLRTCQETKISPLTVQTSMLNILKTSKKKSPQQSLFFTSNALEDDEIFSCPGKFKFKCVQTKKY